MHIKWYAVQLTRVLKFCYIALNEVEYKYTAAEVLSHKWWRSWYSNWVAGWTTETLCFVYEARKDQLWGPHDFLFKG